MDTLRLMAEAVRPLATREEVMRAFTAGDFEALMGHYYAIAMQKGLEKAHLLGDEALDLIQEVALHIHKTLTAWRAGERVLPKSKWLSFWVYVEADRSVREWFYSNRGTGYRSSRLAAAINRAVARLQANLGREPRPEEIAQELGIPPEVVEEALAVAEAEAILSLDDTTEKGTPYREMIAQEEEDDLAALEALEQAIEKYRLKKHLGQEEVQLLDRFLEGEDLEEDDLTRLEEALKAAMTRAQVKVA